MSKIIEKIDPYKHVGTYNLTNRMGGQIREKIDLGLSELTSLSLGQIRKTSVNFFPN